MYYVWFEQKRLFESREFHQCLYHRREDFEFPEEINDRSKFYSIDALTWFRRYNHHQRSRSILNDFMSVSGDLKNLMCHLKQTINLLQLPIPIDQIVDDVFKHRINLINRSSCIRRSIFECQLMRDAAKFFNDFEEFLRNESHRFLPGP